MMNIQWRLPWGLRHALVVLFNLAIRLTDRPGLNRGFPADFLYVLVARPNVDPRS
jgi:hypothetical protein